MSPTTILVPRGAEAAAVRRARVPARIVEHMAGAAAVVELPEFRPGERVLVAGVCGGLWRLRAGDVAIYARVRDANTAIDLDPAVVDELSAALPHAIVANACTTRRVVTRVDARTALAQRYNADVVDMEGTHIAAALTAQGVRFGMVRVVSDDAARDLPPIDDAIDADGRVQPVPIALAFARAPFAAFSFVRNVGGALAALTDVVRAVSGVPA
jgi:nucleoside phosphorylase